MYSYSSRYTYEAKVAELCRVLEIWVAIDLDSDLAIDGRIYACMHAPCMRLTRLSRSTCASTLTALAPWCCEADI
jgi:hypothetical protein